MVVLGSVKGHGVCRISEMGCSSVFRGENWVSSKGVKFLMLYGLGGMMRGENLGRGGLGIFRAMCCVVDRGWGVDFISDYVLL